MPRIFPPARWVIAMAAVAALGIAPPASAAKASGHPDTTIADGAQTVGAGVISRVGAGESLNTTVTAPTTVRFTVAAHIMGGSATVTFVGGGGSPNFVVHYLNAAGGDITLAVTGTGFKLRRVSSGATVHITMVVAVKASAGGTSGNLAVLASTPSGGDMVEAYVTAR